MGKPGGFFKKLKAKQQRAASQRRRGTKGASKEERRHKQDERVEYYAAKREADDLAAVSSSSDSEVSTDSEQEGTQRDRKLLKLRRMLGITNNASSGKSIRKKGNARVGGGGAMPSGKRARAEESGSDADVISDSEGERGEDDEEGEDGLLLDNSVSGDEGRKGRAAAGRRPPGKSAALGKKSNKTKKKSGDEEIDEEEESEVDDWETFLGGADAADADDDEDTVDEDDDEDRLHDDDLLIDNISDDDVPSEDDEEGGEVNPFFELLEDGGEDGEDEEELIDPDEFEEEEVEEEDDSDEEEADEDDAEDEFVDEDASNSDVDDDEEEEVDSKGKKKKTAAAKKKAKQQDAESRALLPQFTLGTTSLATLQSSGVLANPKDPWYLKYHVDTMTEIDRTPLASVPVSAAALEVLAVANDARRARAKARETEEGTAVTRKDMQFVAPEDYVAVHPENVSVAATAAARAYLQQHPPFQAAAAAAAAAATSSSSASSSPSPPKAMQRPPYMHEALWQKWLQYRLGSDDENDLSYYRNTAGEALTAEERGFFDVLQGYADVMDCTRCWQNGESRRELFVLHLLNHWFKARAVVFAHDKMLAAHKERRRRRRQKRQAVAAAAAGEEKDKLAAEKVKNKKARRVEFVDEQDLDNEDEDEDDDEDLELRDRGFGKTRVLVMLPMRNQAYEYVNTIVRVLGANPADCPKLSTFEADFTEVAEAMDPTFKRRPREYQRQFAGNIDDSFCVGLRLEPNRVHVYTHPLNSDIILCSPLGLRRRLEKNGDVLVSLAAIEVCIVDEAHVLLEQNWQQVTAVMELLNKRPTDTTHGLSDLRRVYAWALEGKSGRHRQTVISSDLSNATILSTFRASVNTFGKVVLQHRTEEGILAKVQVPVRQHFIRFEPQSLAEVGNDRFEFFTTNVYPTKISPLVERDVRTIIVVPSYFDFTRLRNYMFREYRESFTAISEYTSVKQQRRALGQFSDLERPVLLVTERFYFFKRYFVKFAEVLVFYSPPLFPSFYASLVNRLVATSPNAFVTTVFCQYDTHELNRIIGTTRMAHMLERESGIFSFVTS